MSSPYFYSDNPKENLECLKSLLSKKEKLFTEIIDFAKYMVGRGWHIDDVQFSGVSASTYVSYHIEIGDFDSPYYHEHFVEIRHSDHMAKSWHGHNFTYVPSLGVTGNYKFVDDIVFEEWWFKEGGFEKTEREYGELANELADTRDPKKQMDNLYSSILEKIAREERLHMKPIE